MPLIMCIISPAKHFKYIGQTLQNTILTAYDYKGIKFNEQVTYIDRLFICPFNIKSTNIAQ